MRAVTTFKGLVATPHNLSLDTDVRGRGFANAAIAGQS